MNTHGVMDRNNICEYLYLTIRVQKGLGGSHSLCWQIRPSGIIRNEKRNSYRTLSCCSSFPVSQTLMLIYTISGYKHMKLPDNGVMDRNNICAIPHHLLRQHINTLCTTGESKCLFVKHQQIYMAVNYTYSSTYFCSSSLN